MSPRISSEFHSDFLIRLQFYRHLLRSSGLILKVGLSVYSLTLLKRVLDVDQGIEICLWPNSLVLIQFTEQPGNNEHC